MQGDGFGVSFSPGQQGGQGQAQGAGRPSPVQQAIQTLSLKLPRVAGAGSVAPDALLNSAGGGQLGGPTDAASMLEAIKRMLFGNQGGQPGQMHNLPMPGRQAAPGGTMPGPNPGGFQAPEPPPYLTPHIAPTEGKPEPPPSPAGLQSTPTVDPGITKQTGPDEWVTRSSGQF